MAEKRNRLKLALATLAFGLWAAVAYSAGQKTGGDYVITDDLTTGSAGSVRLTGTGFELDGTLGQVAASTADVAGLNVESGYISKMSTVPLTAVFTGVNVSSLSVDWLDPGNPYGTQYTVEISTNLDFSYPVHSSTTLLFTSTITALVSSGTYHLRIKSSYMEGYDSERMPYAVEEQTLDEGVAITTQAPSTYPDAVSSYRKLVRASNGDYYYVYRKKYGVPAKYRIFVARSQDEGETWHDTIAGPIESDGANCDDAGGTPQAFPTIAVDSKDILHVAWRSWRRVGFTQYCWEGLRYSSAPAPGAQWAPSSVMPGAYPYAGGDGEAPSMAVDSWGGVHIVWGGEDAGFGANNQLRYSSRAAESPGFGPYVLLPGGGAEANHYPSLAIDSKDQLQVLYSREGDAVPPNDNLERIAYSSKSAFGGSWSSLADIIDETINDRPQGAPSLAVASNGDLHAVWSGADDETGGQRLVMHARKAAGSLTWDPYTKIQDVPGGGDQDYPSIAVDDTGRLHVVWRGSDTANSALNIKYSMFNGAWSGWTNLTTGSTDRDRPTVRWSGYANNSGGLHYTWWDTADGLTWRIKFAKDTSITMPQGFPPSGWTQKWSDGVLGAARAVSWGDLDNDGDLDLAVGYYSGPSGHVVVYRNDGSGNLSHAWDNAGSQSVTDLDWGDFDNDGDLDLAVAIDGGVNLIYVNLGDGTFNAVPIAIGAESEASQAIRWGDFDNDGDLDLAVANDSGGLSRVYRNEGGGIFVSAQTLSPGNASAVGWADFDNDGDLDLAVAYRNNTSYFYKNDGSGNLSSAGSTPTDIFASLAWGDFDKDGDQDIVFGGLTTPSKLFCNDGNGTFTQCWSSPVGTFGRAAWADFDHDGDLDLLLANDGGPSQVYRNEGGTNFIVQWATATDNGALAAAWADADKDGDLDMALGTGLWGASLLKGAVQGADTPPLPPAGLGFLAAWDEHLSTMTFTWDQGDYDGRGDPDTVTYAVAVATASMIVDADLNTIVYPSSSSAVNGTTFTFTWNFGSPLNGSYLRPAYKVWPGDAVAKHGVILSTSPNEGGQLLMNTTYFFRAQTIDNGLMRSPWSAEVSTITPPVPPSDVMLAEVNWTSATMSWTPRPGFPQQESCEGYEFQASSHSDFSYPVHSSRTLNYALDRLTLKTLEAGTTYYFRVGSLGWTGQAFFYDAPVSSHTYGWQSVWSGPMEYAAHVAWGDYDNDGDLDLAAANSGGTDRVYRNEGGGVFALTWDGSGPEPTSAVAWCDLDGDGDLDLATGNDGNDRVYWNDGAGGFGVMTTITESDSARAVSCGDFDNDGDLDLAVANSNGQPNRVYKNTGERAFDFGWSSSESEWTAAMAWGDYDNDGDLDLAAGNAAGTARRVYQNDGNGSLVSVWSEGGETGHAVAWGDFDNDGDLDFATAGNGADRVYRNDGNNVFTRGFEDMDPDSGRGVAWADYDNDGYLDLVVAHEDERTRVYHNDGSGVFSLVWSSTETGGSQAAAWADFDGDGQLDLAVANGPTLPVRVYKGYLPSSNSRPAAPESTEFSASLVYGVDKSTLSFMWPVTGNATTYALAVATQPMTVSADGLMIVNPSSATFSTFTLTWTFGSPLMGNHIRPATKDGKHYIYLSSGTDAPGSPIRPGTTYYYRVQTIDNGLARSGWSGQRFIYAPRVCEARETVADGTWSDPNVWRYGVLPSSCSPVTINAGHKVAVDLWDAKAGAVDVYGELAFHNVKHSSLTLTGDLRVKPGGHLLMGSEATPIQAGTTAHLVLGYGPVAGKYGLIVEDGGDFTVRGSTKSPYAIASAGIPLNGTSVLLPAEQIQGWMPGDAIVIGPTSGSGPGASEEKTISGIGGNTVSWVGGLAVERVFWSTRPIIVANLTRNVLVRSSGTDTANNSAYILNLARNTTSFDLAYGEFAYLGTSADGKHGIEFYPWVHGSLSSSTVRNGSHGLVLNEYSSGTFARNTLYGAATHGMSFVNSASNTVVENVICGNTGGGDGIWLLSQGSDLIGNMIFANSGFGVSLQNGSKADLFDSNTVFSNAAYGFSVLGASHTFWGNNVYASNATGIYVNASSRNTFIDNRSHGNSGHGLFLDAGSEDNNFAGDILHSNVYSGAVLASAGKNLFLYPRIFDNKEWGLYVSNVSDPPLVQDGVFGYDEDEAESKDDKGEVGMAATVPGMVELRRARMNPALPVDPAGIDAEKKWVASFNQDYDTGTVRFWGDSVEDSTISFTYSGMLYESTATGVRLMRGVGHKGRVESIDDTRAVAQIISIEYWGGQWHVEGSSSGPDMASFSGDQIIPIPVPGTDPQFYLTFDENTPAQDGDLLDFALLTQSYDKDRQKKFLFGPAAPGFREGRSKMAMKDTGGFEFIGEPGYPTVVDTLPGATYYTLVDSGAFTAIHSSFTNMYGNGIQLSGNKGVFIATSTFDSMGIASAVNAYITVTDLISSNTEFHDVEFGNSRSTHGAPSAYNVYAEGDVTGLELEFFGRKGELWGGLHEYDPAGKIGWAHCEPIASRQSGAWSAESTWEDMVVPDECNQVVISTDHVVSVDITTAAASTTTVYGTLSFSRVYGSSLTLVGGDILVKPNGHLDMGTEASPIPSGVYAALILSSGSYAGQYGLIVEDGGDFTVRGEVKDPYGRFYGNIPAGGSNLTIRLEDTEGWSVGDSIILGPTQGSGISTTEERVVSSISPMDPFVEIGWGIGLVNPRYGTSTSPVLVANLSRNVLVRSSGTDVNANTAYIWDLAQNATSFDLSYGEFAYLGGGDITKAGINVDGGARARINSCTIRAGKWGLRSLPAMGLELERNIVYKNLSDGLLLDNGSGNMLSGNVVAANASRGLVLSSVSSDLEENWFFSNNSEGAWVGNGQFDWVASNAFFCNGSAGLRLQGTKQGSVEDNRSYANATAGVEADAGSDYNLFASNRYYSNPTGVAVSYSTGNVFVDESVFMNGNGFGFTGWWKTSVADSRVGYDDQGNDLTNTVQDFALTSPPSGGNDITLKQTRIHGAPSDGPAGFDQEGNYALSYNQDYATGTVQFWGDYIVSGSTLTLDYATQLYASTATTPKLMRGSNHTLSVSTDAISDPNAVSQLVVVEYDGGQWHVHGSSSGDDLVTPSTAIRTICRSRLSARSSTSPWTRTLRV